MVNACLGFCFVLLCLSPGALDHHISLISARAGDWIVKVSHGGLSMSMGMTPKRNPEHKVKMNFPDW